MTNTSNSVLEANDYYPFGHIMPGRSYLSGTATRERFTGKERGGEGGWDYFGARYYVPAIGRWLVTDPLAEAYASWSPYNYVSNNPTRFFDPFGLCPAGVGHLEEYDDEKGNRIRCYDPNPELAVEAEREEGYVVEEHRFLGGWLAWAMRSDGHRDGEQWIRADGYWYRVYAEDAAQWMGGAPGGGLVGPPGTQAGALSGIIRGFTKHGLHQALTRGFRTADIAKIVREGKALEATGRYGPQTRYILGENTVVINSQGKIITVFSSAPGGNFVPF